ncbi:alpha/beta hydrolase [Terasakiella sp. A23]|uniref:alpha/beta fold hydrolase n=1 Tax=Terasakiella sp. FCG-A23 TaxID=3080561 RepID=UPI00295519DF|nr:alpha/beta hydrolase [Terasakiella sp. A23]MDV7338671.1 alpha/beta hydrolase [Terasakiella sp. A23]
MQQKSFLSLGPHGFHKIAYTEWGKDNASHTAVCVHGLTRNSRDFDDFAQSLSDSHHVFCPDIAGRGYSDWLINPQDYGFPVYVNDMAALLARIGKEKIDWIGTSMGGIIGMMLAAQPNSPIQRLIINDVGPFIPKESLARIADYLGLNPKFNSMDELEAHLRLVHEPFGNLTDKQWRHLAEHSAKRCEDDKLALHYDPALAIPIRESEPVDVDLWPLWDAVKCPVLILRGEKSDLLTRETAQEMLKRGPDAELVEIPQVGHAPTLMDEDQIGLVKQWLNS